MSTPQLERLHEHCHRLRLYQVEQELTARLEQAAKSNTVHLGNQAMLSFEQLSGAWRQEDRGGENSSKSERRGTSYRLH
jgi:hypothetical protein